VADAVHGRESATAATATTAPTLGERFGGTPDLLKKREKLDPGERPPFDADAT